jgi:hypothetical protein
LWTTRTYVPTPVEKECRLILYYNFRQKCFATNISPTLIYSF